MGVNFGCKAGPVRRDGIYERGDVVFGSRQITSRMHGRCLPKQNNNPIHTEPREDLHFGYPELESREDNLRMSHRDLDLIVLFSKGVSR